MVYTLCKCYDAGTYCTSEIYSLMVKTAYCVSYMDIVQD